MKPNAEDVVTFILLTMTSIYITAVVPVFFLVYFGMGFAGDQTSDPRIDLVKSLAVVSAPGQLICALWWLEFKLTRKPQR